MLAQLLRPEIREMIKEEDLHSLREALTPWPPVEIAKLLRVLSDEEVLILFRLLTHEQAAATMVIRSLSLGELHLRDWWRVMAREILSGFTLGLLLGAIGFLRVITWHYFFGMYGTHVVLIAITVWISLIGVVSWGTLTGSMLPFILKRLGADPAVSSAPVVATLVDVVGMVIYFTFAALILSGSLL